MNDRTEAARKANATRKALKLNLTETEARKLSPKMKQLIKAFAAMGINYHSSVEGEWVVADVAGMSRVITVFTTSNEYIDFNFNAGGDFTYLFVGTTDTEDGEICPACGEPNSGGSQDDNPATPVS
jgi:uncharacterized protein YccT (UPF0319 family)